MLPTGMSIELADCVSNRSCTELAGAVTMSKGHGTPSLAPSSCPLPYILSALVTRVGTDVSLRAYCSTGIYSQCFEQQWVSVLTDAHYGEKLLWLRLRAALTCVYKQ